MQINGFILHKINIFFLIYIVEMSKAPIDTQCMISNEKNKMGQ